MNNKSVTILLLISCSILITTCKKPEKEMVVSTGTVIEYSANSVKVSGQIIDLGEGAIKYGHCYGTTPGVNIKSSASTNNGEPNKTGDFTSELKNLEGGITYYVKAYISDGIKPVYGSEINFTLCTPPSVPAVGAITQPTCSVATGSVALSGLPATGTWTLTRTPGGTTTTGTGTNTTISVLEAGTYTFTVTNASSCVSAASGNITINTQPASPSAPIVGAITQPTCSIATGSVALSGLPATGTWTLKSTPGGTTTTGTGTTKIVSGLPAGATYTFTVTNASGCVSAASGNVAINTQLGSPSAPVVGTITQPTCTVATGSVALSGLPATGTWTLTRTPGGTTTTGTGISTTLSGLAAGTYTFTVTNASGCVSAASGNVAINTQPATPSAPVAGTITQPICSVPTGSVVLSGLPSSGTWTLTRTPGGTTTTGSGTSMTVSGLPAGATYTFTITIASGCFSAASGNVVINTQPASPSAPVVGTITQPTCTVATGSVALTGLPSAGTWTLTRTPGGTTTTGTGTSTTVSGLPAGTYTFTVTNASGCVSAASNSIVINLLPGPSATTSYASNILNISATLNATVNANGYSTIVTFEYGTDTNYGKTINAAQSPVTGTSNIAVNAGVSGLSPNILYHFRVKAVSCGGTNYGTDMIFTTHLCPTTITVIHYTGDVSPVSKTLIYGIVQTNLSGTNKCWINKNLGADDLANSATDPREEAAGWYWQFNRKQGFKHDGSTRTPSTSWITSIDENSNWTLANDPCNILLGTGWRLPTYSEWANADGSWNSSLDTYASVLKLHVAGLLGPSDGKLYFRGSYGFYWSSTQGSTNTRGLYLDFRDSWSNTAYCSKWYAYPVRCLKD